MERFSISDASINISDILDVIEMTDPSFAEQNRAATHDVEMISGSGCLEPTRKPPPQPLQQQQQQPQPQPQQQPQPQPQQSTAATGSTASGNGRQMPRVEIVEQPASKSLRFRYECEGRSAGSIPGVNSTPENKTFPTIRIVGYKGRAMVVVSCVTKDPPYRPHPHNLVGKEVCKDGVCTVRISSESMTVSFDKLGIQCVKRKDIEEALKVRQKNKVDPFGTGFDHKRQSTSIDLNAVRLCFHVFLEGQGKGKFIPLLPIVSEPIYDKKAMSDLVICKLSHCSASVAGGTDMILLCEKVAKEDIQVRFFEERDGQLQWEGFGNFQSSHVHKQVAIAFQTPKYRMQQIDRPIYVFVQLRRPSDGTVSDPVDFMFLPLEQDDECNSLRRKRQKFNNSPRAQVLRHLQAEAEKKPSLLNQLPQYNFSLIKPEPRDVLPPFGGSSMSTAPSSPIFQVGNVNAPNISGLRAINSPRRTPSPMGCALYNIPPPPQVQHILASQLQPNIMPQDTIPPILMQDPLAINEPPERENNLTLGNTHIVSNAIENTVNIGGVLDNTTQSTGDFDLNFSQFDNVDLTSLNISDIVKEGVNREVTADSNSAEESGMTDSFTKLTRNTIQELCSLNSIYKPIRDDLDFKYN